MPLILLPGLLNTARLWAEQVGALGTGRVIAVLDTASADSIPALASRALNRAPPRFALAGPVHGRLCRVRDVAAGA